MRHNEDAQPPNPCSRRALPQVKVRNFESIASPPPKEGVDGTTPPTRLMSVPSMERLVDSSYGSLSSADPGPSSPGSSANNLSLARLSAPMRSSTSVESLDGAALQMQLQLFAKHVADSTPPTPPTVDAADTPASTFHSMFRSAAWDGGRVAPTPEASRDTATGAYAHGTASRRTAAVATGAKKGTRHGQAQGWH